MLAPIQYVPTRELKVESLKSTPENDYKQSLLQLPKTKKTELFEVANI